MIFWEYTLVFIIVAGSITVGLSRGYLLETLKKAIVRNLPLPLEIPVGKLLYCSQCLGFWVGIVLSFFVDPHVSHNGLINILAGGMVSSYFSSLFDRLVYGPPSTDDRQ